MKPTLKLAETAIASGSRLTLYEHDGRYCIRLNGQELMNSLVPASELLLGELAVARLPANDTRVLIGGLGLGFTLKGVVAKVGPRTAVDVAELVPAVVDWNRTFLAHLNGRLLSDPRVKVLIQDVRLVIQQAAQGPYDSILLDLDNGPTAMIQPENSRLYSATGIRALAAALKPGGRAAFWSAGPDRAFADRLTRAGFKVAAVAAKQYATAKRFAHVIYLADR